MDWLPIESAPKEGLLIATGWNHDTPGAERHYAVVWLEDGEFIDTHGAIYGYLTHWMPLPAPPEQEPT